MRINFCLIVALFFGFERPALSESEFWGTLQGKHYSVAALGLTELEKGKDVNRNILLEKENAFPLQLTSPKDRTDLALGKVLVSYKLFQGDHFRKDFSSLPTLVNHEIFKGAVVSAVSGVFVSDTRPREFHYPDQILSKERMEQSVRKMTFLTKMSDFQVKADKMVKALGMKFHIPFVFEASWFLQPDHQWMGSENNRLTPQEMEVLTAHVSKGVLQNEETLTHMVEILGTADDRYVRGVATLFISFLSPDEKHALVCFWQFVAANDLTVVKVLSHIPFVGGRIEDKLKKTALRDFARNVDVIRSN